jgi:hypothetical protein
MCPECGGEIDWAEVDRRETEPPRIYAVTLLLAPHLIWITIACGVSIGLRAMGGREPPAGVILLLVLAYAVASPFCAIAGVHAWMGRPNRVASRVTAAIMGVALCIAPTVVGIIAMLISLD